MKKVSNVVFALFFLIILGPSFAESAGRGGGIGGEYREFREDVANRKVAVHISPEQFQVTVAQFKEKHPEYRCEKLSDSVDKESYRIKCIIKDDAPNSGEELYLIMDKIVHLHVLKKRRN